MNFEIMTPHNQPKLPEDMRAVLRIVVKELHEDLDAIAKEIDDGHSACVAGALIDHIDACKGYNNTLTVWILEQMATLGLQMRTRNQN